MLSVTTFLIHTSVCPQVELRVKTYEWTNKKAQTQTEVIDVSFFLCAIDFIVVSKHQRAMLSANSVFVNPTHTHQQERRPENLIHWRKESINKQKTCNSLRDMLSKHQLPAFEIRRLIGPDFRELHHKVMWLFWSGSQAELRSMLGARPVSLHKSTYVCWRMYFYMKVYYESRYLPRA